MQISGLHENSLIQIYFIIVPVTQIGRRDRVYCAEHAARPRRG
jgi:hypothetical protein